MAAILQLRDLHKTYGEGAAAVHAVCGVTLEVRGGELLVLMGPSGSGKTTLLSMMGCILRASSGSILVDGLETTHLAESRLPKVRLDHFGFIFQGFNLFPALTALENVEVALDLKKIRGRGARKRALDLLTLVGLQDKAYEFPDNLSGGQKQRVAIARALAGDPQIVLADEPTAALDFGSGRKVLEILHASTRERNRAVVVVTHDPRVLDYADRIVKLEDGRIVEEIARREAPEVVS